MILPSATNTNELGTFTLLLLKEEIEAELKKRSAKRWEEAATKLINAINEFADANEGIFITTDENGNDTEIDIGKIHSIYSTKFETGFSFRA